MQGQTILDCITGLYMSIRVHVVLS